MAMPFACRDLCHGRLSWSLLARLVSSGIDVCTLVSWESSNEALDDRKDLKAQPFVAIEVKSPKNLQDTHRSNHNFRCPQKTVNTCRRWNSALFHVTIRKVTWTGCLFPWHDSCNMMMNIAEAVVSFSNRPDFGHSQLLLCAISGPPIVICDLGSAHLNQTGANKLNCNVMEWQSLWTCQVKLKCYPSQKCPGALARLSNLAAEQNTKSAHQADCDIAGEFRHHQIKAFMVWPRWCILIWPSELRLFDQSRRTTRGLAFRILLGWEKWMKWMKLQHEVLFAQPGRDVHRKAAEHERTSSEHSLADNADNIW